LAFLDEDDPFSPDPTEPSDRLGPPDHDRQVRLRRLIAAVAFVLILILVVLGVRGCLNARKERQFENYVRDLEALTAESQQLSDELFGPEGLFENPQNLSELEFEAELKADRGAAEGLVDRARNLDGPGELKPAQANLVLAFELRRDGLAEISNEIGTALGDEGSDEAIAAIAEDMQFFVAGDVLYRRAQQQINEALAEQCPTCGEASSSQFLPDIKWLDPATIQTTVSEITGEAAGPSGGGIHGLGLVTDGVIAQPGGVTLTLDTPVTVSGLESLEVPVENQGESDESDVEVTVEADGEVVGTGTIDTIAPAEIATVEVPLDPAPAPGDSVDLTVIVAPVPGEQVADNNEGTYPVTVE